jgi:hypothetical protein
MFCARATVFTQGLSFLITAASKFDRTVCARFGGWWIRKMEMRGFARENSAREAKLSNGCFGKLGGHFHLPGGEVEIFERSENISGGANV